MESIIFTLRILLIEALIIGGLDGMINGNISAKGYSIERNKKLKFIFYNLKEK